MCEEPRVAVRRRGGGCRLALGVGIPTGLPSGSRDRGVIAYPCIDLPVRASEAPAAAPPRAEAGPASPAIAVAEGR
jgi:hypothetical protein